MGDEQLLRKLAGRFKTGGQHHEKGRPCAGAALDTNLTAMVPDNAVDDAEAEPGALADVPRGEERIEDAPEVLLGDPVAGIRDGQLHGRRFVDVTGTDPQT